MSNIGDKKGKSKKSTVDDDELLDQCIKSNELCYHSTCEKSIKLVNIQCQFCNKYFCTSHALPEIHGCGNAARKAPAPIKQPKEEHMRILEKKMSNKLEKMKNDRKKKGK